MRKVGLLLVGIVFLTIFSILLVQAVEGEEVQITSGLSVLSYNVYGDIVVFEARDESEPEELQDLPEGVVAVEGGGIRGKSYIYIYNLTSEELRKTIEGRFPSIHGNYVVFSDSEKIILYDLRDNSHQIISSVVEPPAFPLIYGNYIIYNDLHYGSYNYGSIVYIYDIGTAEESELFRKGSELEETAIKVRTLDDFYENIITYTLEESSSNGFNIDAWFYDLDSSTHTRLTSDDEFQFSPLVYGDTIVWVEEVEKWSEKAIYYYNFPAGNEMLLELDYYLGKGATPEISFADNKLVWRGSRHFNIPLIGRVMYLLFGIGDNQEIYLYDFETGIERRITENPEQQFSPEISGNRVFWIDDRNDGLDLYMLELI